MAFESGFSAGSNLPMVDHPLKALIEGLQSGVKTGSELAQLPTSMAYKQALTNEAQQKAKMHEFLNAQLAKYGKNDSGNGENKMPNPLGDDFIEESIRKAMGLTGVSESTKQKYALDTNEKQKRQEKQIEKDEGTTTSITDNQTKAKSRKKVLPLLKKILKEGSSYLGGVGTAINASDKARYEGDINEALELFVSATGLKGTEGGFEKAEKILKRQDYEDEDAYLDRLGNVIGRLEGEDEPAAPQVDNIEVIEEKVINGKTYVKKANGKVYIK